METDPPRTGTLRERLHTVIFEADTRAGKAFDVVLLVAILASIVAVCLESVPSIRAEHGALLKRIEWGLTIAFTAEYILRLACVSRPMGYARSFYGVVDLVSILPSYLGLLFAGGHSLMVIRALRLLRIFRVFKLGHFVAEGDMLYRALAASRRKILVFLGAVLTLVLILGTLMYLVEGGRGGGFKSIPESVYWAIVTMTTVGYGDIAPQTVAGKTLASAVMIAGYGIIAVPTGIVTAELANRRPQRLVSSQRCEACAFADHEADARFCKRCGEAL